MYFTQGSALTIIALLVGLVFSAWALLVGSALVFHRKAQISQSLIQYAPFRSFFLGGVLLFLIGVISLAFLSAPVPLAKFIGYGGLMFIFSLAAVGGGGLVLHVADRLRLYDPKLRSSVSLQRAALLIVASGLVPLLGLFVIFPAVLAIGMGTAVQAIFMRNEVVATNPDYTR